MACAPPRLAEVRAIRDGASPEEQCARYVLIEERVQLGYQPLAHGRPIAPAPVDRGDRVALGEEVVDELPEAHGNRVEPAIPADYFEPFGNVVGDTEVRSTTRRRKPHCVAVAHPVCESAVVVHLPEKEVLRNGNDTVGGEDAARFDEEGVLVEPMHSRGDDDEPEPGLSERQLFGPRGRNSMFSVRGCDLDHRRHDVYANDLSSDGAQRSGRMPWTARHVKCPINDTPIGNQGCKMLNRP